MEYLLAIGIAMLAGLMLTRLTKRFNLPDVTSYLIAGLLVGPLVLGRLGIPGLGFTSFDFVGEMSLISDVALGFIAFSIGNEFRLEDLKHIGRQATIIGIVQALTATLLVDAALFVLHLILGNEVLPLSTCLILGAIATATAPAATIMVINQYKAKGPLTSILLHTLLLGRQRRDDILQDVGGIAFYSRGNHYHPLEAGREILFSDVRIWSQEPDNPDDEDSPYLLGTLWAHGAEISLPLDGNLTLEPKKELYRGHHTAQIRTLNETPYHVWVWPSLRLHLDLRPHREEYCITFYLKSNMTGNIGFSLTRLNHYNDLPYAIPIPRRDTWIPVCIRNLSFSEYAGSSPYVTSAIFYIYANYSRSIQVKEIADYCHISVPHLSRLFREQTGQTIKDYIAMQRINAAQQMLINTSLPLERIAHAVGFYDTQHLSRTFARYIGMRPNTYRKMRQ